jgi:hypothetical protein
VKSGAAPPVTAAMTGGIISQPESSTASHRLVKPGILFMAISCQK